MPLHVSVDFGTSSTCTVVSVDGGEPQVVVIDGSPLIPSAVFAAADGTLFVGQEAERQAAVDPSRFEPHPKRRIDEGELLLGDSVLRVGDVIGTVLRRAVGEARRYAAGAGVDLLVLTHPAGWGSMRVRELRHAAANLARELVMVPEPVGAAVFHSAGHGLPDGGALAVLDFGGGTVDASVVRKQGRTFRVLATRGDPHFGGADIDQALLDHVGGLATDQRAWRQLVEGREMAERRRRRVLRQDVKGAKETLSRHSYTDVPMPSPFSDAHVTRSDLERLIFERLSAAADLVPATLREGEVGRDRLSGVFLVGGSSRIPMISRLIHQRTGVVPTTLDQPETVVARGALRAVRLDPERTGGLPPTGSTPAAPPRPPTARAPRPEPSGSGSATDSLSRASTIVIGGSDPTRQVTVPTRRRGRGFWILVAGLVALLAVGAGIVLIMSAEGGGRARADPRHTSRYGYHFDYPTGWRQGGGDPAKWETRVSPSKASDSYVSVREGRLDYDVEAERERSVSELRRYYEQQVAAGQRLSGFEPRARFAGEDVVHYRERLAETTVDWYVLHEKHSRISVGCRYAAEVAERIRRACRQVVSSLRPG